jgi:hypothetical protein
MDNGEIETCLAFDLFQVSYCFMRKWQDFSADVTSAVTEDSRHKKLEAFSDLSKAVKV